jgi:chromosome segregation ATPase
MMAGRKKGPPKSPPPTGDGERAFAVVVEQLRGEFKVFGEALGGLREEVGGLRQQMTDGFARVDRELGEIRRDVGEVKQDLAEVQRDLGEVKRELGEVKRDVGEVKRELGDVKVDLGLVKSAVTTHTRELREIRGALGNKVERGEVEAIVDHAVARTAQR